MSRSTLKQIAVWGALSLGGMAQTASAQWMPFGGGCGACEVPQIPPSICGPTCGTCAVQQPQFVMQPVTETRTCERIVQRPVYETKYVNVPQTEYRTEYDTRVANVPTVSYQTVTEMQTRQRDCGQYVTSYRCRPQIAPCAYDSRPGLFGMMNRTLFQARMALTPAVVAERTYVPNVITEQIPVQRTVAIPGTRQVSYQVPRTVAITTNRQVAVQQVRMVAERVSQPVTVTTMRMVPFGSTGVAYGIQPGVGTALVPGMTPTVAVPPVVDPLGVRTAERPMPIPPRSPGSSVAPAITPEVTPASPPPVVPNPPKGVQMRVVPPRDADEEEAVEEVAQTTAPIRHTAGYRPNTPLIGVAVSAPSIVRVSAWANRRPIADQASDVSVAATAKTRK